MDSRLRRLERAHKAAPGDDEVRARYCLALIQGGEVTKARRLLHPKVKRNLTVRSLFVGILPADSNAFCPYCGAAHLLGPRGYPTTKGKEYKNKKKCADCREKHRREAGRRRHRRGFGNQSLLPREYYCQRCGVMKANQPAHRCGGTLPDWMTGGDAVTENTGSNWTDARHMIRR